MGNHLSMRSVPVAPAPVPVPVTPVVILKKPEMHRQLTPQPQQHKEEMFQTAVMATITQ